MKKLLKAVLSSKLILSICSSIASAIENISKYIYSKHQHDKQQKEEEKYEDYCKKINNIADNGTIDDILDLRK